MSDHWLRRQILLCITVWVEVYMYARLIRVKIQCHNFVNFSEDTMVCCHLFRFYVHLFKTTVIKKHKALWEIQTIFWFVSWIFISLKFPLHKQALLLELAALNQVTSHSLLCLLWVKENIYFAFWHHQHNSIIKIRSVD